MKKNRSSTMSPCRSVLIRLTGIHGPSASGKSTLLKLLMRFWDVDAGSVRIGNVDVRDLRTTALRAHESYMTQDTHLFHDTIENNIRFVRPAGHA